MTEALVLDRHALKQAHRRIRLHYSALMGRDGRPARQYSVFEVILYAYPDMDADTLVARIESLVTDHGPDVRRVIEDHSPGAPDYVEFRDWLYDGPDVLLVADLARSYPSRLRAVACRSDFSTELETMADAFNGK
jgi:hypothetical protein